MYITKPLFWLWRTLPLSVRLRWMLVSSFNQKFLVGASAVILNDCQEVLLFEHTYRSPYAWGIPSGWLKRGEDPADCLVREVYEESHMEVNITGVLSVSAAKSVPRVDLIYQGRFVGGDFKPSSEVSAAAFFAPDRLPPLLANQYALIKLAIEHDKDRREQ